MELAEILERCRDRDEVAWEVLVRTYEARVYAITYHYVGNSEDARDLAQDVFVRVYRHIHMCVEPQMFLPWLIRIARNASIDHIRRRKARPPSQDIEAGEASFIPANGRNPEEQCAESSRTRLIHKAIRELTDLNREIIILKEILGLSLEEVASMLQVPLGTIKSRSNRARLELARKLLADGIGLSGKMA